MRFSKFDEIADLCRNRVPEALQLEFKEKSHPDRPELDNADKKTIAKAVSAFANSGGGILIFGIRSARSGDVDVAADLKPIKDPEVCRVQVEYVCRTNVSPEVSGLHVEALAGPDRRGVIVCNVPPSERRPHMSTAPNVHTYYRRTFQGDVPMTPFEVREQVLAIRSAVLEPVVAYPAAGMFSPGRHWISANFSIVFSLKNVGQILCRNPFLRVRADCDLTSMMATFDPRLDAWKTTFPDGTIIHVDDQEHCLSLSFNGCIYVDLLTEMFSKRLTDFTEAVMIFPGSPDHVVKTITDKSSLDGIDFRLRFGAENAPISEKTIAFSRKDLAKGVLSQTHVREMYMQTYGGNWPQDQIDAFKAS